MTHAAAFARQIRRGLMMGWGAVRQPFDVAMDTVPNACPYGGLVLLYGAIFDAVAEQERYGPILGLHEDVAPEAAKAGYIGISSLWMYEDAPNLYLCPRCHNDPILKKPHD